MISTHSRLARWTPFLPPVLVLGFSLLLTFPLWQPDFIQTADARLHLLRIFELDQALRDGILYPRWSENLYYGYGYPVFNFYPPLSYAVVETFHILGLDWIASLKLFFALCFPLAAFGMYLLVRSYSVALLSERWQAEAAAVLSAVAYAASPYLIIDIYFRGALAEMLAMALLPYLLWAMRGIILDSAPAALGMVSPSSFVLRLSSTIALTALFVTLLVLSHNLTTYFAAPVLILYALVLIFTLPAWRMRVNALLRLALAALIGLGLSAFYWLPAIVELPLVYVGQPEIATIPLHDRLVEHFLPLDRLFDLSWLYTYVQAPWSLSLSGFLLAAVGLIGAWRFLNHKLKFELGFWAIVVVLVTFLLTEFARPLWLALPSLWVIQFPWRLTVFWAIGVALLIGLVPIAIIGLFSSPRIKFDASKRPLLVWSVVLLICANFVLVALYNLRPIPWQLPTEQTMTVGVLARDEVSSQVPGASFFLPPIAEYLPYSVKTVPTPKLRTTVPDDSPAAGAPTITLASFKPQSFAFNVTAPSPFRLTLRAFHYPDWHASLDTTPLPTYPATAFGVVGVDVPAGTHQIRLEQTATDAVLLGNILTALGGIALTVLVLLSFRAHEAERFLPLIALAFTLPFFLLPAARALTAAPIQMTPVQVNVGTNAEANPLLRVIGYGVKRGLENTLRVDLLWQVLDRVPEEQPIQVRMVDEAGSVITDREQYARYATGWMASWQRNQLAQDQYDLPLPNGLECKPYSLELKRGADSFVRLGAVTIPDCPLQPLAAAPAHEALDVRYGANILLAGLTQTPEESASKTYLPGDTVQLELLWQTPTRLLEDYNMTIQLVDRTGEKIAQTDGAAGLGYAPTSLWLKDRVVRDPRTLTIPADSAPGILDIKVGVYHAVSTLYLPPTVNGVPQDEELVSIGTVRVAPIPPSTPPTINLNATLGDSIRLVGANGELSVENTPSTRVGGSDHLRVNGTRAQALDLELLWQRTASAPIAQDYTVFLHIVDAAGQLVGQVDRQPVSGKYPTSLWQSNETVTDTYQLNMDTLAPGRYTIYTGMYDNATGARLPVHNAPGQRLEDDRVLLADVVITE